MTAQITPLPPQAPSSVTSSADGRPILSVRDLHIWYELRRFGIGLAGYVRAVDGVSFDLRRGEAIAIVGESGCGKSSLMKAILGLHRPTKGQVLFDGEDIHARGNKGLQEYRGRVGYVQQDPYGALPPFMSVERILKEPLIIGGVRDKKVIRERIYRAMEEVKLYPVEDFLSKFPHMLSGGQQQRVVIARAMIRDPQLIVADEPVSMLDASVRVEILRLLDSLQKSHNLSFIYITHDLSTVKYFSERIFVMYAGKLVEMGPIGKVIRNPLHPYTQALIDATSDPDANNALKMREVPAGEPPSLLNPPSGCRFHPRCSKIIQGLCEKEEPPYFRPESEHLAACWLHQ